MSFREIIYSNDRRPRLTRHLLFWMAYALYFAMQSYFPNSDPRATGGYFAYVALFSTAMYFPFCFLSAYLLLYYLYPRYLRWGRHFAFASRFLALIVLGFIVNYLTGIIFYRYSHWGAPSVFNIAFLGGHNTIIAMITSVSILGLRLGRDAWLQHEANGRLAAQKARAELQLLKTRIDPQMLFRKLDQLSSELEHKVPGSAAAILRLSEDLSDILYNGDGGIDLASDDHSRYKPEAQPDISQPTEKANVLIFNALFSPKPAVRITRHLLFWLVRFAVLGVTYHAQMYMSHPLVVITWATALKASLLELSGEMLLSYGIAYGLFPLFFERRKYWRFAASTLALMIVVFVVTYPEQMNFHFPRHATGAAYFWNALMEFIRTGFNTWLLFIAWRLNKQYFRRIRERTQLSKEKADVEFQLLKAQVHPHFLFNTLNNIYSFALDRSPRAGELLGRLTSMMRYMIYDCEAERMPLDRELQLLEDYIGLEKARYGDRLDMQVRIEGLTGRRRIAPLLMIPFIENCFKHGASQVLDHPWVKLDIYSGEDQLDFRLSNNTPRAAAVNGAANAAINGVNGGLSRGTGGVDAGVAGGAGGGIGGGIAGKNGIGLKNIRQRLELLYPNHYQLEIRSAGDRFSVRLVVPLDKEEAAGVLKTDRNGH